MRATNEFSKKGATGGLSIGELAERTGCTAEAIRYYEREGVVPRPARTGTGRYRQYGDADVERFAFLRRARELGFSLAEVRELLAFNDGDPARSCSDVDAMARAHLAQVDAKLAQLNALRAALSAVINQCEGGLAVADCRILGALAGHEHER
jgi:DNA-binding transcriptional MerR regulator